MSDAVNGICREDFPGGTIITIRDASLPVVRWVAAAPGGAALDPEGKSGALSVASLARRQASTYHPRPEKWSANSKANHAL